MIEVDILGTAGLEHVAKYQRLPMSRCDRADGLGPKDVGLMRKLVLAGDEHAKIMRMVVAWMTIRASRGWWQQFDTYRIGVEKLSQSTMHTLLRDGVRAQDFTPETPETAIATLQQVITDGDLLRAKAALPEGFMQTRFVMASYQALRRTWLQRREHKLPEWLEFLDTLRQELPLAEELIFCE